MACGYLFTKSYGAAGMAIAKYVVIGSIPVIASLYASIRSDLMLLAGQLALVYAIAALGIGAVSLGFSFSPAAQFALGILSMLAVWGIYYRMFGSDLGFKALGSLRAERVEAMRVDA
jgi:hypothetical protein